METEDGTEVPGVTGVGGSVDVEGGWVEVEDWSSGNLERLVSRFFRWHRL